MILIDLQFFEKLGHFYCKYYWSFWDKTWTKGSWQFWNTYIFEIHRTGNLFQIFWEYPGYESMSWENNLKYQWKSEQKIEYDFPYTIMFNYQGSKMYFQSTCICSTSPWLYRHGMDELGKKCFSTVTAFTKSWTTDCAPS